jgi:hypothetical protein
MKTIIEPFKLTTPAQREEILRRTYAGVARVDEDRSPLSVT